MLQFKLALNIYRKSIFILVRMKMCRDASDYDKGYLLANHSCVLKGDFSWKPKQGQLAFNLIVKIKGVAAKSCGLNVTRFRLYSKAKSFTLISLAGLKSIAYFVAIAS